MFLNVGAHRLFSNSVPVMKVLFIKMPPRIDHDLTQDMAERTDAQDYSVWGAGGERHWKGELAVHTRPPFLPQAAGPFSC